MSIPQLEAFGVQEGGQNQSISTDRETMAVSKRVKFLFALCVVASIAGVIMIASSFSDIEFYEMAFIQDTLTGKVDRGRVYFAGRYFTGFNRKFKKFPRDLQFIKFNITIFNADKLEVTLSGALQYFLNKDELKLLHDTYDLGYRPIIEKTALQAIKIAAPKFTVTEYRLEREKIKEDLSNAVKIALGGICCPKDIETYGADPGCKTYSNCTDSDKGVFCILKYFQLEVVGITQEQQERFLKNVLEQEKYFTEQFKQKEKIERKNTEKEKKVILNLVDEVTQQAAANSSYIKAKADAYAMAVKEAARNEGLNLVYSQVNITDAAHKASLDYIRTLLNHKGVSLYVGYNSLIGREGGK